jgi:uncharacterized Zn-binding protein involved in type VI secretion
MSKPAARVGDMHVCPMVTPGLPPIPHVGGPIMPPGAPTVFIGGMPAATMGSMCTCVGPPDSIVLGSMGVLIVGKPAARMGDMCAHGGSIILGCPTVLIGEAGGGGGGGGGGAASLMFTEILKELTSGLPPEQAKTVNQVVTLKEAARDGKALVEICG